MALFCIPKKFIDVLKNSALKDNIQLEQVYNMSNKERKAYFKKYTNEDVSIFLNARFEEAQLSKSADAITSWAKSVFAPKEKKTATYKSVLDKIQQFKDAGVVGSKAEDVLIEDIITEKLGVNITKEEMATIVEKSNKIEEAQRVVGNNLGNPLYEKENIDYFKSIKDINDYMQSITPSSKLAITSSTIGRGMMLMSLKSPVLNIGSNTMMAISEGVIKRLSTGQFSGTDNSLAVRYITFAQKIYNETGFDVSRMINVQDFGESGARVLGKGVHTQGAGKTRFIGRLVEQIVFKNLMGAPDAFFAACQFADSVNLYAMKAANGDKAKARNIMIEAMKIGGAISEEAQVVRAQAILDAQYATFTNNSSLAELATATRGGINKITGNWKVGDFLYPFVKTPANVVSSGIDYSIGGVAKSLYSVSEAIYNGNLNDEAMIKEAIRNAVRSGFGLMLAYSLMSFFKPEDFVGAYDKSRSQIAALENSVENSVKIGGKWVSVDWFGPIAVPLTAMLYARTYGSKGTSEASFQFAKATVWDRGIKQLPVIGDLMDTASTAYSKRNMSLGEMVKETGGWSIDQLSARLVPSILSDIAKATDEYQRKNDGPISALMAKIPGVRETLPVKENVFGNKMKTEDAISTFFFGSRVKTASTDPVVLELDRVMREAEKNVTFTDWRKTSSTKIEELRNKVGEDKFHDYTVQYGQRLYRGLQKIISSNSYKNADDEEKIALLNNADTQAQKEIFQNIHFIPTKKKKK